MPIRKPLAFVVLVFVASRVVLCKLGVRLSPGTVLGHECAAFPQIVDPELLRSRLLESLFYLHSQPPLFNLILGRRPASICSSPGSGFAPGPVPSSQPRCR